MYRYKRLLINLNLRKSDSNLIKISSVISRMARSEKVYFLFTEKQLDFPDELIKEYPQLTESVADFAREKVNDIITEVFKKGETPETHVIIQEGDVLDEVLKQIRINGIDLVISGTSQEQPESVNLAVKLARKAPCSVLAVPEETNLNLDNPAVAVDFSDYSADAMDAAMAFSKAGNVPVLKMIHAFEVPTGFHKTGKSYEEFADIMKGHARKRFSEFNQQFEPGTVKIEEHYQLGVKPLESIKEVIKNEGITFLVLGARGRSAGTAVMLGSITERLIEQLNIPVLAVKKKGTGLNILDAIFN